MWLPFLFDWFSGKAEDRIAVIDDLVAVSDEDHGVVRKFLGQALKEDGLGLCIEGGAELIQEQDGAGTEKGTGDGDALSLTFGETCSGFHALGVKTGWQ